MTLIHDVDSLKREVLEAFGGGQTRSSVELVTELTAPYEAVTHALDQLLEAHAIREAYTADGETFYRRSSGW